MMQAQASTILISSDLSCPWARVAVLHKTRKHLGLEAHVTFDNRAFPLELENREPTPKSLVDSEVAILGALEPDAGWQRWQAPESAYPVNTLLALEAVQAAKEQNCKPARSWTGPSGTPSSPRAAASRCATSRSSQSTPPLA